jgi:GT2 family glycosyltransferase
MLCNELSTPSSSSLSPPPRELIVVIDHNPNLFHRLQQSRPALRVVQNPGARGDSGARSHGIALATGNVVAFMDDDASAERDWLARLLDCYTDSRVAGVGGWAGPDWETARPRWLPPEFDWVIGCTYLGMRTTPGPVRNFFGCNMSFRRDVFLRVGGFRDALGRVGSAPTGCEETELCIRVLQDNPDNVLLYEPRARVHHQVPVSRTRWRYFRSRCWAEGRSKARMARFVGSTAALKTEWAYTLGALPRGVGRGVLDTLRGDPSGIARSGTIVAGLGLTTAGFLQERLIAILPKLLGSRAG